MEGKQNVLVQVPTVEITEIVSITEICRICANQQDKLIGIYSDDGEVNNLSYKMNSYLPVKVNKTDELPLQCCWQCASTVLAWHELFLTSIEADRRLRSYQFVTEKQKENDLQQTKTTLEQNNDIKESDNSESEEDICEKLNSPIRNLDYKDAVDLSSKSCILCTLSFNTKSKLKNHMLEVHKMKRPAPVDRKKIDIFACTECNKSFTRKFDMQRHIKRKHPQTSIEPSVRCKNLEMANKCKITEPDETYYQCNICQNKFSTSSVFITHYNIHVNNKLHCCHICGKKYHRSAHLKRHLDQLHYGIKYSCEYCDQTFTSKTTRDEHLNTHTNNRPYMCDTCGKSFRQSSSLYVHKLFHRDIFPYSCNICDKKFRRNGELKKHTFIHTGERQFSCAICKRPFRLRQDLKRHMKIHNIGQNSTSSK
ncbi:zinc finger protein 100-like isoform X2 [Diorhabda carinulata]|uniref:zinc finger protein 100-like isoform X2 n=1 Tax=Diorhabda carinulata TaxID=1163345 RepID=UPI0025A270E2|nr:zinc finger protein 100-like isoform X2 [Diorhabda carinulata]